MKQILRHATSAIALIASMLPASVQAQPATMEDFWNRRAFFELDTRFDTASPNGGFKWANPNNAIQVKDGVWYLFGREVFEPRPSNCGTAQKSSARIVVRQSTNQGQTWSAPTVVVEVTPGATGCELADPGAFFDEDTRRWHVLYQCVGTGASPWPWNICHSSLSAESPMARFVDDPGNPVVRNGTLWQRVWSGHGLKDEGTPEIAYKEGGYFYVTFHGYHGSGPIDLYRGVARTRDFVNWEPVNNAPIHAPSDCSRWYGRWNDKCYGGGHGTTQREGSLHYLLVESSDRDGFCKPGQHWNLGLLRSPSLTTTMGNWDTALTLGLVFSSHELVYLDPDALAKDQAITDPEWRRDGKSIACGVGYQKLFRDETGTQRLAVFRAPNPKFGSDSDPGGGHFIYSLRRDAPALHWAFREGDWDKPNDRERRSYTQSDTVSRGNLEAAAILVGTSTDSDDGTYSLAFHRNPSSVVAAVENGEAYDISGDFTLRIRARLDAAPTTGSSFIAGKLDAYWMELYPNGQLCLWARDRATGQGSAACQSLSGRLGQWHVYTGSLSSGALSLRIDGEAAGTTAFPGVPASSDKLFHLGAFTAVPDGLYGGFDGLVDDVKLYHIGTVPPPPPPSCDDGNGCTDDRYDPTNGCQSTFASRCLTPIMTLLMSESCGDGQLDAGEQCDDGNILAGDGCSEACILDGAPIAGRKLTLTDAGMAARSLTFESRDPAINLAGDLQPTVDGVTLQVFNPVTRESAGLSLPAGGGAWTVSGAAPNLVYRYRDRRSQHGPCDSATLRSGSFKVKCRSKTQPIGMSLDESVQGTLVVELASGGQRYCTVFGGTVSADRGRRATGGRGTFAASGAPAADACPVPPPR